eukprot:7215195-Prorocentrum_lima.AAC.1
MSTREHAKGWSVKSPNSFKQCRCVCRPRCMSVGPNAFPQGAKGPAVGDLRRSASAEVKTMSSNS